MPRPFPLLMILAALSVAGCGVEQAQPAPVIDQDEWGHLPPDPDRPQQAGQDGAADTALKG